MPPIIHVSEIEKYNGQEVTVKGWVYNRTDKGKFVFLLIRDGSGFVQYVAFKGDLDEETFDQLVCIPQESSVIVTSFIRADGRAPGFPGGLELITTGFDQLEHYKNKLELISIRLAAMVSPSDKFVEHRIILYCFFSFSTS